MLVSDFGTIARVDYWTDCYWWQGQGMLRCVLAQLKFQTNCVQPGDHQNSVREWYQHVWRRRGLCKWPVRNRTVIHFFPAYLSARWYYPRGRAIKDLKFRRSEIIVSTKIYWGVHSGPNAKGLSRKQWVNTFCRCLLSNRPLQALSKARRSLWSACNSTT